MSYTPDSLVACPNLQTNLTNIFNATSNVLYTQPIPLTEFLMSPSNRNGLEQLVRPGGGKLRTVELTYQPRILESEVESDVATSDLCTATTERGNTSAEYTIDETSNLFVQQKFSADSMIRSCEANELFFENQIMKMVVALDTKVNAKNATQTYALLGGWSAEVDQISNATLNGNALELRTLVPSSTYEPFPVSIEALDAAAMVSGFGQYAVIGGMTWFQYNRNLRAGCCTSYGLNVGEIQAFYGSANMYDKHVVAATGSGADNFVLANGAVQLLWYTRGEGLFGARYSGGAQNYGTITSPATGLDYDLVIKHDCYNISVTLTATTKVVGMPADMFQTGDDMEGVTGAALMTVVNS